MAFVTKDSGERVEFPSGMRRDTDRGKPRYDLIDLSMLRRWAELMARGAEKYGEDNWRLAQTETERRRFRASAFRHFVQWMAGEDDEDHAAAIMFNVAAAEAVGNDLSGDCCRFRAGATAGVGPAGDREVGGPPTGEEGRE